ncbi:hypothetical protein [Flavobacterium sp.]|uniref:hypothetical protein n=1 Tax=Flavobacterium sp. TaxID=239 RepID=UPI003D09CEBF
MARSDIRDMQMIEQKLLFEKYRASKLTVMKQLNIAIAGMLAVSCSTVKIEQQIPGFC